MKNIIITGGAGFIGSNLIDKLLSTNSVKILCIDNFDDFYDKGIKYKNIEHNFNNPNFTFLEEDILNFESLNSKINNNYDAIIHIAAKAGVRPSIIDPKLYQEVNIIGTQNILEIARIKKIKQFVFASSSSVYGNNKNFPWKEDNYILKPISPYASSKISCELLGHVYSHLYSIRFIALRFFTVYGPRQRPDLAINKFFRKIINNKAIDIYGKGNSIRDYTYIDDIVDGIISSLKYDKTNYEIINLGNNKPISLMDLIGLIEKIIQKKTIKNYLPEQEGDVFKTYADINKANKLLNYFPKIEIEEGLNLYYKYLKTNFF